MNITKLSAQLINPKNQSLKRVSLMLLVINEKTIPMIERIGTKKEQSHDRTSAVKGTPQVDRIDDNTDRAHGNGDIDAF